MEPSRPGVTPMETKHQRTPKCGRRTLFTEKEAQELWRTNVNLISMGSAALREEILPSPSLEGELGGRIAEGNGMRKSQGLAPSRRVSLRLGERRTGGQGCVLGGEEAEGTTAGGGGGGGVLAGQGAFTLRWVTG